MLEMVRSLYALAALCLCSPLTWAVPADESPPSAQNARSCAGVTNEVTKGRELNRELNAYAGQTVPDELQQRVWKHVSLIAKLKAECEQNRDQAALKK
jgi:hypothetical protein